MTLITYQINLIKSKPHTLSLLYTFGCHGPRILKIWMDHQHTDYCSQILVSAKYLCCTECNQNRQEYVCSISKKIGEHKYRA